MDREREREKVRHIGRQEDKKEKEERKDWEEKEERKGDRRERHDKVKR